jgi:hypothetical protein
MYQLMPVVLGTALRGGGGIWIHFGLHAAGLPLLVGGFMAGRFELVAAGGVLMAAGIVLLAQAVIRTFWASTRRDVAAWCFPLAASWLVLTVLVGVSIAALRHWPVVAYSPLGFLRAHAHLGFAGFFLTLLQGTTFQLVPMFTMGDARRPRFAAAGLVSAQAGLLVLAGALAFEQPALTAAGAALIVLGVICSGIAFVATLRTRRRRQLEPSLKGFVFGAAFLALSTAAGVALLAAPSGLLVLRGATAYGLVVVAGGLALTVLGMLGKIIPFLVWMRTYGPRIGREVVPSATTLASRPLERTWLTLHLAALPLLAGAALFDSRSAAAAGAWLLAAAIAAFLANAARVFGHTWKPQSTRAPQPLTTRS